LKKHHQNWKSNSSDSLFYAPSIDDHACWDHATEEEDATPKTVFSDALASLLDVFLDDTISVAPAKEGAEKVPTTGRNVEEAGLQRRSKLKAWIEDVANGCKKGVHVPHEGRGGEGLWEWLIYEDRDSRRMKTYHKKQVRIAI
jgi:hypothetical protein